MNRQIALVILSLLILSCKGGRAAGTLPPVTSDDPAVVTPSGDPSRDASAEPSAEPSPDPSEEPSEEPSQDPAPEPFTLTVDGDAMRVVFSGRSTGGENLLLTLAPVSANHTVQLDQYTIGNESFRSYTDWVGPWNMRTVASTSQTEKAWGFTGGWHGSNGDGTGDPTARTQRIAVVADGEPVPEGEAEPQAMDEIQMSILALKDSIGQGRELKEREKEREELAEALEADYIELADREDILKNYQRIVAEQDAIVADCTQKRDAAKAQIAQLTAGVEQAQAQLDALREQHAMQLQPIESDLGRARAAADQAKNDERSRKSELGAAESELRKAAEGDANTMAAARHQLVQDAYDEAVARSNQAKERLAQVQKAYDDAKQRAEQAQGPLTRNIEDMNAQIEALKEQVNGLGDEISVARNRRQYCDAVYQYPDETAKMRAEVQEAEELARQMDEENDALREQLADSRRKARTAKIAIAVVIILIIIIVVAFVAAAGR